MPFRGGAAPAAAQCSIALPVSCMCSDNVWTIKSWAAKKMGGDPAAIDRALEIDDTFDYVA